MSMNIYISKMCVCVCIYMRYHELPQTLLDYHQKCHTFISNILILEFPPKQNKNAVLP